jgi:chromosome segregation ATPase
LFVFAILITFTFILIISFIPVLVLQLYYTISKEEERKLEDIKDKVVTRQATIQAQAEQLEVMLESLDKGAEAERQLTVRITDKNSELDDVLWNLADKSTELDEVKQDMTDKKSEVREQEQKLTIIREDVDEMIQKAKFAEELIDYFRNTNSGEREKAYFEKMMDLRYEKECLKRQNEELKTENRSLRVKLEKAYDFMKQFTINGMNMLEHFLRSIGEWVQQKVAGMSK